MLLPDESNITSVSKFSISDIMTFSDTDLHQVVFDTQEDIRKNPDRFFSLYSRRNFSTWRYDSS